MAIVLLGSMMPAARAADPPCPSPVPGTSAPQGAAASPGAAAQAAEAHPGESADDGSIRVSSDQATLGVDGNATLKGNVEVRQGAKEIRANEVQYDNNKRSIQTDGQIDYQDPLVHVTGAAGSYSADAGAAFRSAQFTLRQRGARGTAQEMLLTPQGVLDLKGVTFTTCPLSDNSWQLRAREITLDTHTRIGTGHNAQVDFMGVPLVYLPWMSFPLSGERKSGFLFPSIGNTSKGGVQVSAPYYWNIAPNADFTFQPVYYTRRGVDLGGDLRFLTESQHGELDWNYLPYDSNFGGSRSRVRLSDVAELPENFRLTVHAEDVSDTNYFQDFSQGPEGASTAFLERAATLSYRDEHWRIGALAQQYQTIDVQNVQGTARPYARLPRIVLDADFSFGSRAVVRYGFDSELVDFHRSIDGPDTNGWRADLEPRASLDITGPGYFMRPAFAWRLTQYELDTLGQGLTARAPSRSVPLASFDTGLVFERETGSRNQRRLTLEPRVLYLYVPYRNQDQLPVFDTALPDLNPVQLFRNNRYVGADRVSDAHQVSVGVTSRLLDAGDGRQFLAATFGQTYYFDTPRVTLPNEAPTQGNRSDLVAQLALTAFQDWSADMAVQWDPQASRSERTQLNLQYKPAPDSVINLGYRYQRFEFIPGQPGQPGYEQGFDQVEFSTSWPIKRRWHVFLRDVYSVRDNTELERFAGFEYRACCWRVRLGARRFVSSFDPTKPQETGIWLQLELAGLAGVGSASDAFLTEEIRGYTPPDAVNHKSQASLKSVW